MTYSIIQSSNIPKKFSIIKGKVSPAGYPVGICGKDWDYLTLNGKIVLSDINISCAREICEGLNNGRLVADYFDEAPGFYYGCEAHQNFGDDWFYNN